MVSPFTPTVPGDDALESAGVVREAPPPARLASPEDYRVDGEVARGGIGRILRAWDRRHARPVAIKVLLRAGEAATRRFEREALVTARLTHPSIIPLYEMGRWSDDVPFYVMKLVDGRSLADTVAAAATPAQRLALLPHVLAVCDALAYAHGRRIVHRDLKPANVLVGPFGETVVIDWGLAKDLAAAAVDEPEDATEPSSEDLTRAGAVLGTPRYMAPEQARGEAVDERADVYALGALAHHVLSGAAPPAEGRALPDAPRDLAAIIDRAMAARAADRYPSAKELADDLRAFLAGDEVSAYAYSWRERVGRWSARHRTLVLASVAFLALLVLSIAASLVVLVRANARAETSARIARERLVAAHEEQGRRFALDGDHRRALVYLSAAYAAGAHGPGLRYLLARSSGVLALERAVLGHAQGLQAARFTPDGRLILTAGFDPVGAIWDASTGARIAELRGHTDALTRIEPSRDGRFAVTSSRDHTARVWAVPSGAPVATLAGHTDRVYSAVFSPDGERVLTASRDGTARLWERGGREVAVLRCGARVDAAYFLDGGGVVTGSRDGVVRLWDAASGALRRELPRLPEDLVRLAVDDRGTLVAALSGRSLTLWSADGRLLATVQHELPPQRVAVDGAGTAVAVGSEDGATVVYDASGARRRTLHGTRGAVTGLAFSPDGALLAVAAGDPVVEVWELRSGDLVASLAGHDDEIFSLTFAPDGRSLVTASQDHTARLWSSAGSGRREAVSVTVGGVDFAARSRDQRRLVVVGGDGAGVVLEGGEAVARFTAANGAADLRFDGARLVYPRRDRPTASVLALPEGRERCELVGHGGPLRWAELSPDGTAIVTGGEDGTARVWDAETCRERQRFNGHVGPISHASFDPAGTRIATGGEDGSARVWDVASGRELRRVTGSNFMLSSRFDPTGRLLLTGNADKQAELWEVDGGGLVRSFEGHRAGVLYAVIDPSGELVVTASSDGTAMVWDVASGRALGVLRHQGEVTAATFAPDGATLLTGSRDNFVRIWDTSLETRSPAELAELTARRIPLKLQGEALVRRLGDR